MQLHTPTSLSRNQLKHHIALCQYDLKRLRAYLLIERSTDVPRFKARVICRGR